MKILDLPSEVLTHIFQYLSTNDLFSCSKVSSLLRSLIPVGVEIAHFIESNPSYSLKRMTKRELFRKKSGFTVITPSEIEPPRNSYKIYELSFRFTRCLNRRRVITSIILRVYNKGHISLYLPDNLDSPTAQSFKKLTKDRYKLYLSPEKAIRCCFTRSMFAFSLLKGWRKNHRILDQHLKPIDPSVENVSSNDTTKVQKIDEATLNDMKIRGFFMRRP